MRHNIVQFLCHIYHKAVVVEYAIIPKIMYNPWSTCKTRVTTHEYSLSYAHIAQMSQIARFDAPPTFRCFKYAAPAYARTN